MSSNGDEDKDGDQTTKKRKLHRACDMCRQRKVRCDGSQSPGSRCPNCIIYHFDCTYDEVAKKRGPSKGYVERLEDQVKKLDGLLRRLCPDESLYKQLLDGPTNSWTAEQLLDPSIVVGGTPRVTHDDCATITIRSVNKEDEDPTEDDEEILVVDGLKKMELGLLEQPFFGKSSGAMLIRTAVEFKTEYTGYSSIDSTENPLKNHRKEFWSVRPWEHEPAIHTNPRLIFPEPDLAEDCINLYFANVNLYLPLLHRPTFERDVRGGLHFTDESFAHVYLLVCAAGARYSSDPRVLLNGVDSFHSAGWKWFNQVQDARKSLLWPPTLYHLQRYCIAVQFLQGASAPQPCWAMLGIGLRLAEEVGAHRRKPSNHTMTAEDEMWKRAFWVLVCIDRMMSSSLGRPYAIQDEDIDADLPIDCDDEYWDNEDPEKRFKQPPNKPSRVTAFVLYVKLHQILAFATRTIFSINKSKIQLGFVGEQWKKQIVSELDSALNKWVDSVPDHLRWDPNRQDIAFFNQSVTLYSFYYHIQILIHRTFIPSPGKPSPLSFPSLAICTNAARSCSHIADVQRKRNTTPATMPQIHVSVFFAGIILLLSIWGGKRSGITTDANKEMADVHMCMRVLRKAEERWHYVGKLWDILYELASVGELPLPQPSPPQSTSVNKRNWDSETYHSGPPSASLFSSDEPRNIAGSRKANQHRQQNISYEPPPHASSPSIHNYLDSSRSLSGGQPLQDSAFSSMTSSPVLPLEECFALPVYSNELGRIPLHRGITFSAQAPAQLQPQQNQHHWEFGYLAGAGGDGGISASADTITIENPGGETGLGMLSNHGHLASGRFGSLAESSTAVGMDTANLVTPTGHAFDDTIMGYTPQSSLYGMGGPTDSMMRTPTAENHPDGVPSLNQVPDDMFTFVSNDTISMWLNAPTGFELDEWGTYLASVSELTQGHVNGGDSAEFS